MKAIAKCPKCGKILVEECKACIEFEESTHECMGKMKTIKVKWKLTPENEKELNNLEKL